MAQINRGNHENNVLSEKEQRERDSLPKGIGLSISSLWDFHKEPYLTFNHLIRYFHMGFHLWETLLQFHEPPKELKFLDVGCGYGEMKTFIQRYRRPKGYTTQYIGLDGDPLRVKRCREIFPSGDFREGFLPDALDTVGNGFTGLVCGETYEHLTKEEGEILLRKLHAISEDKAVVLFTIPTPEWGAKRPPNEVHQNEISPEDFIRTATEAGWTVYNWFWIRPNAGAIKERYANVNRTIALPILAPSLPVETGGQDALYVLVK